RAAQLSGGQLGNCWAVRIEWIKSRIGVLRPRSTCTCLGNWSPPSLVPVTAARQSQGIRPMQEIAALRSSSTLDDRVVFFLEFLKNSRHMGSITPSSRFLERRIVELAEIASAWATVALGTGTGATTRWMVAAGAP